MSADKFLTRLAVLYGAPDTPDEDALFAEYRHAIAGARADVLDLAGDIIRDTHVSRSWPTPGACRAAVTVGANKITPPQPFVAENENLLPPPTADQAARANALVAEFKKSLAHMDVSEKKETRATNMVPDRDAFEGRYSPVLRATYTAPPLAQSRIVKEVERLTDRSRAMMGDRDE